MKYYLTLLFALLLISCQGQQNKKSSDQTQSGAGEQVFTVTKTEKQWRESLTDMQFYVLRKSGTENPGTSEWLKNKAEGTYVCAGCGTPVFKSENKFESGTGWPSFDREIEGNVAFSRDTSFGMVRIEEHCAVCGGHLGHVFEDGPRQTTGMRHCINGAALNFVPSESE